MEHDQKVHAGEGYALWELQRKYLNKFYADRGGWPKREELDAVTKDYLIHLIKEATEVLDEVSWKMHRAPKDRVDRGNLLEEIIDTQKYLWALTQVLGFTWEEYCEEFRRKSAVVEQRYAQETQWSAIAACPVALVDLDGVVFDYPRFFYAWVASERAKTFQSWEHGRIEENPAVTGSYEASGSTQRAEAWYRALPVQSRALVKAAYRMSGAKAHMPVLPGAKQLLAEIRNRGLKVVLLTNRPYDVHHRIYGDTLASLAVNELEYDAILWAHDKGLEAAKKFKNVCWAVDDSAENVRTLREAGIQCAFLDPYDEHRDTRAFLAFVSKTEKIEDVGYQWVAQWG